MVSTLRLCVWTCCAVSATAFGGVNRAFGNCETNGAHFAYAPEWLNNTHGSLLSSDDYALANWWPVTDAPPVCETNLQPQVCGWAKHAAVGRGGVTNYWIERLYEQVPKPIPPAVYRAWTPLTIMRGAKTDGFWTALKNVLDAHDAYDEFMACQYCAECDPSFLGIRAVIVAQIGEEAAVAFLDSLKVEKRGTRDELMGGAL